MISSLLLYQGDATDQYRVDYQRINKQSVARLQKTIGELEARSQRLDEFAKQVIRLAELDSSKFLFSKRTARGGLNRQSSMDQSGDHLSHSQIRQDINFLKKRLTEQTDQLLDINELLSSRALGRLKANSTQRPVKTGYVSSRFGQRRDPFTGRKRHHSGLDIAAPAGSPVYSIAAGKVSYSGWKGGYGRVVEITHENGLISRYAHLQLALVRKGQTIDRGKRIARVGSSGRSTGPHLHLEILKNNRAVNPEKYIKLY